MMRNIPSHLFYNPDDKLLYVADTPNKRIAKLDTQSGTMGSTFSAHETIKRAGTSTARC